MQYLESCHVFKWGKHLAVPGAECPMEQLLPGLQRSVVRDGELKKQQKELMLHSGYAYFHRLAFLDGLCVPFI